MAGISGEARRVLGRLPLPWLGAGLAVVALAVSGLFGGLESVGKPGIPEVPLGQVDEGLPWTVKVTGAGVAKDVPPLKLEKPENRWIVVRAEIEITSDESRFDARKVLRIPGVDGLLGRKEPTGIPPTRVLLGRDSTEVHNLHPNLTEGVLFFWEQRGDAEAPKELDIQIYGLTLRENSFDHSQDWLDPAPRAVVHATVKDLKT